MRAQAIIRKIGGSFYCKIPIKLVKQLNLFNDKYILLDFQKFQPVFFRQCLEAIRKGREVEITYINNKKFSGKITFCDQERIIIFNENQDHSHLSDFAVIASIKEILPTMKIEGDVLNGTSPSIFV